MRMNQSCYHSLRLALGIQILFDGQYLEEVRRRFSL